MNNPKTIDCIRTIFKRRWPRTYVAESMIQEIADAAYRCDLKQSRRRSMVEAVANVFAGYWVAVAATAIVFPMFGIPVEFKQNLIISMFFTAISLVRSYALRRLFNRWHHG